MVDINRAFYENYVLGSKNIVVQCVIIVHPGLANDLRLIGDNQSYVFSSVEVEGIGQTDFLSQVKFDGYPMEIFKSSLDFGDTKATINIRILDAVGLLVDAYNSTRGFERGSVVLFDCMLTSPFLIKNISKYNIFSTSLNNSAIELTVGLSNKLSVAGVNIVYNEETNPGLF